MKTATFKVENVKADSAFDNGAFIQFRRTIVICIDNNDLIYDGSFTHDIDWMIESYLESKEEFYNYEFKLDIAKRAY